MSENTILAQWGSSGEEQLAAATKYIQIQMLAAEKVAISLGEAFAIEEKEIQKVTNRIFALNNAQKLFNEYSKIQEKETRAIIDGLELQAQKAQKAAEATQLLAQAERSRSALRESANIDRSLGGEQRGDLSTFINQQKAAEAQSSKFATAVNRAQVEAVRMNATFDQQGASALGRFNTAIAGGAEKVALLEANVYNATRQSMLFSQQLIMNPIKTLGIFSQSAEKAAIASQYLKEQLMFIAGSRFGSIMILGAAIGAVTETMIAGARAAIEYDSAIHKAASAFVDEGNAALKYDQIQQRLAIGSVAYGKSVKEVGEMLWELKSAGLSGVEAFASMDSAQKLIMAGGEDVAQTTRILVGLYKQFGDEIKGAGSQQEKFAEIAGTLAFVNIKSAATIDTLIQSYKYSAGTAKALGVSFNELSAAIAVSNNRMLFGSTAGTGMNQLMINMTKNWRQFAREFNIAIDPNKPLQFSQFLHAIANDSGLAEKAINRFAETQSLTNARAARVLFAATQGVKEYDDTLAALNKGELKTFLDQIASTRMDTLAIQWSRMTEGIKSMAAEGGSMFKPFKDTSAAIADLIESYHRLGDAQISSGKGVKGSIFAPSESVGNFLGDAFKMDKDNITTMQKWVDVLFFWDPSMLARRSRQATEQIKAEAKQMQDAANAALMQRAEGGDATAQLKVKLLGLGKTGVEAFKDMLEGNQLYEYQLIHEGKTLQEQIAHYKKLRDEAIKQAQGETEGSEKREKNLEKAIQYEKQMADLQSRNTFSQQKAYRETVDIMRSIQDAQKSGGDFKGVDISTQIQRVNENFKIAQETLSRFKPGTDKWNESLKQVEETAKKVAENYAKVNAAIDKAQSATATQGNQAKEQIKNLKESGASPQALDKTALDQYDLATDALKLAKTAQQQLEGLKLQYSALQTMKESGVGFYGGNVSQEMTAKMEEINKKQSQITNQSIDDANKAQEAMKSPDIAQTAEKIQASTGQMNGNFKESVEDVTELNKQLDGTLERVKEIAREQAKAKIGELLEAWKQTLIEEKRRGLNTGGSSGSW
jgi:TP901 family phage tail tape measure protein